MLSEGAEEKEGSRERKRRAHGINGDERALLVTILRVSQNRYRLEMIHFEKILICF
ncbi:hypothetical protein HMPREF1250_1446 [Megasphaera vaginalis (ex Srinivasan et al. 2021)]|uniref:Uncharacterized protein n=1 Tax=Megasphaera vaginalis (ex Srinivasan et al. 2021) TaxID=1111454 RepID=U7UK11_9FIRM|nr:hypothetical protein HMPREF1250_1446 [Megasphaera vaginalis (ex Srinivasan et al. 2021)]